MAIYEMTLSGGWKNGPIPKKEKALTGWSGKGQVRKNNKDKLMKTQEGHRSKRIIKDPGYLPPPSKTLKRHLKVYADRLASLPFSRQRSAAVDSALLLLELGNKSS